MIPRPPRSTRSDTRRPDTTLFRSLFDYTEEEGEERYHLVETTTGRALLSEVLPKGVPLSVINKTLTKKEISRVINYVYRRCGTKDTVVFADQMMYTG